jgi:hypothetical protein
MALAIVFVDNEIPVAVVPSLHYLAPDGLARAAGLDFHIERGRCSSALRQSVLELLLALPPPASSQPKTTREVQT